MSASELDKSDVAGMKIVNECTPDILMTLSRWGSKQAVTLVWLQKLNMAELQFRKKENMCQE